MRFKNGSNKSTDSIDLDTLSSGSKSRMGSIKKNDKKDTKKIVAQKNTSRGKAMLINCFLKLILMPIFVTFFVYLFEVADISKAYEGFSGITYNKQLFAMFILQIVTSFVGYQVALVGCAISLQKICFAIPLTLATPICTIIVLTKRCDFFGVGNCDTHMHDNGTWLVLVSVALWLGQFFATSNYVWKPQDFVMAEEATLFWLPTYDGKYRYPLYKEYAPISGFMLYQQSCVVIKYIIHQNNFKLT